ncbi:SH3 domain-containing protein [Patescibacteria group bacterium]|nr:SH3 domain-containing protein [Patescibacteria group bacterium]
MKTYRLKITGIFFSIIFGAIFILFHPSLVQAANISITGKAKVLNTSNSYLDFTNYNSNAIIDDTTGNFSGYAFLEDMGWVDFGSTDNPLGPVNLNLTTGAVTGKAYVINSAAYLDFTNYNSNVTVVLATGVFSGYVFSEDAGWIDFSDTGVSSSSPFLPTAPSGLSGAADSSTAITWSWTDNSSNETGFRVDDSDNNDKSGNLTANADSWQETGFSANTSYTRHVHAFNTAGDSVASSNATTVTLSSAPTSSNITSDRSTSTWYSTADFTFTNGISGGFGGEMEYFRYAWDTSSTHTWTGSETQWSTGTLTVTAGSDSNSWYLHLKGYNSADAENGTVDLGPYYYDGTAPTVPGAPSTTTPTSDNTPTWSWTASTDVTSGLHVTTPYSAQWCTDSGFVGCGANVATSTTNSYTHSTALADGTWYFKVKATDTASNESSYSSNGSVVVDTIAPTDGSMSYTNGYFTSASVALTVSDGTDALSGINTSTRTFQRQSAGLTLGICGIYGSFSNITPGGTYPDFTDTTVVSGNCYKYQYLISDNAGNQATYSSGNAARIDTSAPSDPGAPSTTTPTNSISQTWVWVAATDAISDIANYAWRVVNNVGTTIANGVTSATSATTNLTQGIYNFFVKAIDNAGNQSNETSGSVVVNTNAPTGTISVNSGTAYTTSSAVTLTLSATDDSDSSSQLSMKISNSSDFSGASYETYATSRSWTLLSGDGTKTVYVKYKDSLGNESSAYSDTITYDATAPASFNLDSPGHENYSNSERPSFKWKAAETPDAVSGLSKYKLEIDNGDSGDFTIDDIPVSRTTDYETSKYLIHYENFSDSDTTNNYISVYTKSSNDWSSDSNSGNNDGKLKEGKRYWKVKAVDNAGNEKEESRTLFVDRSGPSVEATQINDTSSADSLATTDKTPTIYGKTTDSLTGDGLKVASGPKEVEIKFEKRNYLGVYNLHTLATVNISELYWSSDGSKITDNSKQTSNKYSSFSYTPTTDLPLGVYRITLTGKDKASNGGSSSSFTLTIKTYEEIAQIPEVEEVIEELEKEGIPREKIEEVIKEQGIVIPEELQEPSVIAEAIGKIFTGIANLWWKTVDSAKFLAGKIGQGLAFVGNQIKNGVSAVAGAVGKTTNQFLASRKQKNEERKLFLARGYFNLTQKTSGVIRDGLLALANGAEVVNRTVGNTINKTTDGVKALASNVGEGVKTISQQTSRLATAWQTGRESIRKPASEEAQNLATRLRIATSTFIAIVFDNEPTKILFVKIEEVNSTSAMVVWGTNHYATSMVNYGLNTSYGKKIQSDKRVKEHRMELKDLEPGKLYYFEVMSQNKNYVYDAYYTFNTPEKEEEKVKGAVAGETLATITADEGSWVVVRSEPSLKGEVLAKVTDGQSFPSLEEKDGWVKIQLDPSTGSGQVEGWVFGELIEIGDEEQE